MRRTIRFSLLAVAIVSLAGCGTEPSASSGTRLMGAGSTFAYPLYSKWADAFGKVRPDVAIDYQSIGSGGGIGLVTDGRADFGATDGPMTEEQMKTFAQQRGCAVLHLPTALGASVPAYNIANVSAELKFTPRALAGIFLGTITKWNDPELAAANPGVALPSANIEVVHRSDGSGTTFVWTDYLSKVSDEWRTKVGKGLSVNWPVGTGASGNQAVANFVAATPNAIGYVELLYAIQSKLAYGQVQNAAGTFVKAELWSVTAAAAESAQNMPEDFRVSITNALGENSYPISSFTWILVPAKIPDTAKRQALVAFLNWGLTDGQSLADNLSVLTAAGRRCPEGAFGRFQNSMTMTARSDKLRFVLGMSQMAAATVAIVLLVRTGITTWSIVTALITCVLTTMSVMLLRMRHLFFAAH